MNRKELIDALSAKTGHSKADAERNIAALIEIITATLKKGDQRGAGRFRHLRSAQARSAHRPQPGHGSRAQDQGQQGTRFQGRRNPEGRRQRRQEVTPEAVHAFIMYPAGKVAPSRIGEYLQ